MGFQKDFIEFWKDLNEILLRFKTTHGTAGRRGRILHICTRRHISKYIYIYIYILVRIYTLYLLTAIPIKFPRGEVPGPLPPEPCRGLSFLSASCSAVQKRTHHKEHAILHIKIYNPVMGQQKPTNWRAQIWSLCCYHDSPSHFVYG